MILEIIILTIIFELITIIGRLIFGSKKRFNNNFITKPHHLYYGIILMIIYIFIRIDLLFILGASLFFSDLIHHFMYIKLTTGNSEFP